MDYDEYQEGIKRFARPMDSLREAVTNYALGLSEESGYEVLTASTDKLAEEYGDVAWYAARMATALGMRFSDVLDRGVLRVDGRLPLEQQAARLCGVAKKYAYHGKTAPEVLTLMGRHLDALVGAWWRDVRKVGLNPRDVLRANYDKLAARYPNGFTFEAAHAPKE